VSHDLLVSIEGGMLVFDVPQAETAHHDPLPGFGVGRSCWVAEAEQRLRRHSALPR
jgi:hypothetical protein